MKKRPNCKYYEIEDDMKLYHARRRALYRSWITTPRIPYADPGTTASYNKFCRHRKHHSKRNKHR